MRDLARKLNFVLKLLDRGRIFGDVWEYRLDSDSLAEFEVFGSVHFSHATLGNQTKDSKAIG